MNVSFPRVASPAQPTRATLPGATAPGGDFDFSVLDHSREMYFLPGMDRLVATIASRAETPIQVRTEVRGQFLEYVVDGKHPERPIEANLNGSPFVMTSKANPDGSWDLEANTTGGTVAGTVTPEPRGTHFAVLITATGEDEARPCTERIDLGTNGGDRVAVVSGNFACARMSQELTREGEAINIQGQMGDYKISGQLHNGPNGTLVNDIDLGDIHAHQTLTPLSSDPGAALTTAILTR